MSKFKLTIHEPAVIKNRIFFYFDTDCVDFPFSGNSFFLEYSEDVILSKITQRDLSTMLFLFFWPIFNFLHDVRIELPFKINPEELEMWQRLADYQRLSFGQVSIGDMSKRTYEICNGHNLLKVQDCHAEDNAGIVSCFSCGKDSLLQLALYNDFDDSPISGAMVISPMPPQLDHDHPHRLNVVKDICFKKNITINTVKSDLRGKYNNALPLKYGVNWYLNEILDCQLYLAACLPFVRFYGARGVAIASEFDVQRTRLVDGICVADEYFMYHQVCLSILNSMLGKLNGLVVENLIASLSHYNIYYLLANKYQDFFAFQDSCYQKKDASRWCSACIKCFNAAIILLSMGIDPRSIGIDIDKVLWPGASYWNLDDDFRFSETWKNVKYAASLIDVDKAGYFFKNKTLQDFIFCREQRKKRALHTLKSKCTETDNKYVAFVKSGMWEYLPVKLKDKLSTFFLENLEFVDRDHMEDLAVGIRWAQNYVFGTTI